MRLAEARLAASAVNRRGLERIHEPLARLVAQGFTVDEVQAAWDKRQADAQETVSGSRYMPNLAKWLADDSPAGAWAMISAARSAACESERRAELRLCRLSTGGRSFWGCISDRGGQPEVLLDSDGRPIDADAEGSIDDARLAMDRLLGKVA